MELSKSLKELEGTKLPECSLNSSLVVECNRLYETPLSEFTVENLRILIGQKIGLNFLVPLALNVLETDPLISGDLYQGDLLAELVKLPKDFWVTNPDFNNRLVEIKIELVELANTLNNELIPLLNNFDFCTIEQSSK